jgi:hypothetical protein
VTSLRPRVVWWRPDLRHLTAWHHWRSYAGAEPGRGPPRIWGNKNLTTRHHRPSPLEHTRESWLARSVPSPAETESQRDWERQAIWRAAVEGGGRAAGGGARPQAAARLARTGRRIQALRTGPVVRTPQHTRPPDARSTYRRCRPDHQRSAPPIHSFVVICEDIL